MATTRDRMSLSTYAERRTGVPLGGRGSLQRMLHRSLGADTFAGFWRHWNPIWGYYLGRYVHRPLQRILPRPVAVIGTFVVSGAVHDAAILAVTGTPTLVITPWFFVVGVLVVATSRLRLRYRFTAWSLRAGVNVGLVAGAWGITHLAKRILEMSLTS